jgi:hypothetical protein
VIVVVVVASVVTGSLGGSELLSGGSLGLGVQVLNLGLTEDAKRGSQYVDIDQYWVGGGGTYIQVLLLGDL